MAQPNNQNDPIAYNNMVLTQNIALLSSIPIFQYSQIKIENDLIKKENEIIKKENNELREQITHVKRTLSECESSLKKIQYEMSPNKRIKVMSRWRPYIFKQDKESWSDAKVKEIIANIKSIDDIIKLDNNWYKLRHNITLQRLYYIIPPLQKLQQMIGLEQIKKDIFKKIIYWIQNKHNSEYLHTIISGPPGVGKTEFARIYADIFVRLGILKNDKFVEIKRNDLIGEYLGSTTRKTTEILESALGGVLFLDEAYSIGNDEKRDSFAKEAIDMINLFLSEKKSEFMFIIAGYEEDLESCFLSYNQGLRRRFHSHFKIEPYGPIELKNIYNYKIKRSGYNNIIPDHELTIFFQNNAKQFKYYGGDIEKMINEIKQVQALRTFNLGVKNKDVNMDDIIGGFEILKLNNDDTKISGLMYI